MSHAGFGKEEEVWRRKKRAREGKVRGRRLLPRHRRRAAGGE